MKPLILILAGALFAQAFIFIVAKAAGEHAGGNIFEWILS